MLYLSKEGCALAGEGILFIAEGFGESPEGFGFLWSFFERLTRIIVVVR